MKNLLQRLDIKSGKKQAIKRNLSHSLFLSDYVSMQQIYRKKTLLLFSFLFMALHVFQEDNWNLIKSSQTQTSLL